MLKQHCKDTITLYNYLGEVEYRAAYTKTVIRNAYVEENTLTVNVNRLRKKLENAGLTDFIKTKVGSGYIIE